MAWSHNHQHLHQCRQLCRSSDPAPSASALASCARRNASVQALTSRPFAAGRYREQQRHKALCRQGSAPPRRRMPCRPHSLGLREPRKAAGLIPCRLRPPEFSSPIPLTARFAQHYNRSADWQIAAVITTYWGTVISTRFGRSPSAPGTTITSRQTGAPPSVSGFALAKVPPISAALS